MLKPEVTSPGFGRIKILNEPYLHVRWSFIVILPNPGD